VAVLVIDVAFSVDGGRYLYDAGMLSTEGAAVGMSSLTRHLRRGL
jgi:hypothetical protein